MKTTTMKKPVNVGIPYSNEQEREWAIAQAERLGYKKWSLNDKNRNLDSQDNCIWLHHDGSWLDAILSPSNKTISLERPDEELDLSKYHKEEKEDGTIILKPKKKVKVWIEVFLYNGKLDTCSHFSKASLEESKEFGKKQSETFLEVIEREYEI